MTFRMTGTQLMEVAQVGDAPLTRVNVNHMSEVVTREGEKIKAAVFADFEDVIVLAPKVVITDVIPYQRNLFAATIIPKLDVDIPIQSMEGVVIHSIASSVFQPMPGSILGIGNTLGTIIVSLGKAVVAEIAAEITADTMKRIGQRVMPNARIRGRTAAGAGVDKTVQVIPKQGNALQDFVSEVFDENCTWWEFWCWVV